MFCGRVNRRTLGIDVPHDAGYQNEAAVVPLLGLVVEIPTCKLRGVYNSKQIHVEELSNWFVRLIVVKTFLTSLSAFLLGS